MKRTLLAVTLAGIGFALFAQQPGFMRKLLQDHDISVAGEAFFVPAGLVHEGKNIGSGPAKVLATYVVEKGKPVATMVPPQ